MTYNVFGGTLNPAQSILFQNRLCWYGHVLCKEDNGWVKICMEY